MQVTETLAEGLKREYAVTVPASAIAEKMEAKLDAVRADFQMKGFRKGKAPKPLLRKMFAKNLMSEVLDETVNEAMRRHFADSGDLPSQQPEIKLENEKFDEGDDLKVTLKYERLPEVPATDLAALKLERLVAEPQAAEVDEALGKLAEQSGSFAPKEGPAATGDQVTFDFEGRVDGELFEGGAAEDHSLVLGSGQFIPGFEDQLVGVSAGEDKAVEVTFPETYGAKALAGKAAVFACKVKAVAAPAPAAIDEALAVRFGMADLAELRGKMEERLAEEYRGAARQVLKRKLLDALDASVVFDLPEGLVGQEAAQIAHQLWHDENPDHQGHDHPEITPSEEHRKLAVRRVRLGLLLADIGKKAGVEVTEGELNQAIFRQAQRMPGREKQFFDFVRQNPGMMQQMRAPIFEDKVVDYVIALAEVTDRTVTKDELEAAVEALDKED